jgi:hypothetical protein
LILSKENSMSQSYSAIGSLIFYSGKNYAGSMQPVNYGQTGVLAASGTEWNYQSVAMSNMHAFCWSQVNTSDNGVNYQNHIESIVSASIPDLTALYSESQFPLQYLGVDPAKATPVWFDMSAIAGETDAMASTALAGGSTITTLSRPGINGVAAFIETVSGSSVVATCSFGHYDSVSGEISWTGLNAGTLVLEYTGGSVTLLAATGFPEGWALDTPRPQADGSWVIALSGGDAGKDVIGNLSSDKLSIENDGKDAATLTVTVVNAATDEPTAGVSVTWSTTLGKLSASTSVTGTDGTATVTLTDSGDTGSATVTAVLDDGEGASCTVAVANASDSYKVSLTSDRDNIKNDGTDSATLTATVVDGITQQPVPGVTVSWGTTLGTVSASASVTGSDGKATVNLSDNGGTGSAVVTAALANGQKATCTVTVTDASGGYTVRLASDKNSIVNDGTDKATFTATVVDSTTQQPVSDVAVSWSTTLGTLSVRSSVTNGKGRAKVNLTDSGDSGSAVVTARLANGQKATCTVTVTNASGGYRVSLASDKSSIENNGTDTATLTATVVDSSTQQPVPGVTVSWGTTLGTVSASASVTGSDGKATVNLSDNGGTGSAVVTAALANGQKATCTVTVTDASENYTVSLTTDKNEIELDGTDSATITATVVNNNLQPAVGASVNWKTTQGQLSAGSSTTNAEGKASVKLTATGEGAMTVTATLEDSDSESITINTISPTTLFPAFSATNVKEGSLAGTISFELISHEFPGAEWFIFRFYTTSISGSNPGSPTTSLYLTDTTHLILADVAYTVTSSYIQQEMQAFLNYAPPDDQTGTIHVIIDNLNLSTSEWNGGMMQVEYSIGGSPYKSVSSIYIPALLTE